MTILETQNLTHIFPDGNIGIQNINLSFQAGEFTILSGTNGSGKTVLARHFNGLLTPSNGRILFEGKPITNNLNYIRNNIGLVFQDSNNQIVGQTVAEDVAFGPENLGLSPEEVKRRVQKALKAVDLMHLANQRPYVLSGGQKRKLAIAGVLAMEPKIIIFDEPFTGLDYPGVKQVLEQILELYRKNHTIILITHELEKVLAHASRLIVMDRGKVVMDGAPEMVIADIEDFGLKKPYGNLEAMTWLK